MGKQKLKPFLSFYEAKLKKCQNIAKEKSGESRMVNFQKAEVR